MLNAQRSNSEVGVQSNSIGKHMRRKATGRGTEAA
jgi:hypothetical protein